MAARRLSTSGSLSSLDSSSVFDLNSGSRPSTPWVDSENGESSPGAFDESTANSNEKYILVVGGLGYIGSHTALELLREGYNVIIVDNLANSYEGVMRNIKSLASKYCEANGKPTPRLLFHRMSYQDPAMRHLLEQYRTNTTTRSDTTKSALGRDGGLKSRITGVIHFAAHKSVSESIANPLDYYDNNVCGFVGFIRLLGEFEIRNLVFSSSATVYGSKANAGLPLCEDMIVHHPTPVTDSDGNEIVREPACEGLTSPYGRSKYFCEAILADVAHADPAWRITALRYFNPVGCDSSGILGESPRQEPTNLFPVIAQVLSGARERLDVFGTDWDTRDGTAVRDFIHVADVARGHIKALSRGDEEEADDKSFRTYNLGSGTGTTVKEAIDSLAAAANKPVPINWTGRRDGDVGYCVASTEKATKELRWFPRETIPESAKDLWNYIQNTVTIP